VAGSIAAVATALDPCKLVTQTEASALAGVSLGPGVESTADQTKICTYGGQTTNVFTVEVAQAADAAQAAAAFSQEEAQVKSYVQQKLPAGTNASLATSDITGLADKAATVSGMATFSGQTIGISGIYLLKGATFFAFQDLRLGSPPTAAALQAEATTALGRVG
jgi:hypothetical protein